MASSPSSLLLPLGSASAKPLSTNFQGISSDKLRGLFVKCSNLKLGVRGSRTRINGDEMNIIRRRDLIGLVLGVSSIFLDSFEAKGAGLPPEQKPRLCDEACEKELENVPTVTTESGLQYKDIKVGQGPSPPVGFQKLHHLVDGSCPILVSVGPLTNEDLKVAANYVAMIPSGQIFDSIYADQGWTSPFLRSLPLTYPRSLEKGQPYIFRVGSGQVVKGLDEGILTMKVGGKRRLYVPGPLAFPKGLISAPGRPRVAANSPVIFDVSLEYIPGLESDEE